MAPSPPVAAAPPVAAPLPAAPPVVAPPPAAPPSTAPAAAAPPPPPATPEEAWAAALSTLDGFAREIVGGNAAFVSFEKGILRLAVRHEMWRSRVRDDLRHVDLAAFFPGFRNMDVVLEGDVGQTGREARAEDTERRRADARAAAETSPTLKRVLSVFGGQVEAVEPSEGEAVTPAGEESIDD